MLGEKIREIVQIASLTSTPFKLMLDRFRLYPRPFVAINKHGHKLKLNPHSGEWFTFLENLGRADYLKHGINICAGDAIVDLGANIGAFTILAAHAIGPSGRVFSYEPNLEAYARLCENIRLNNLSNVTCFREAVCDRTGFARMFSNKKSAHFSLHSKVGGRDHSGNATFEVPCVSIREVVERVGGAIGLLKIDIEGAEYKLLDALDSATCKSIRQISMEIHPVDGLSSKDISGRLELLGFATKDCYPFVAFNASN